MSTNKDIFAAFWELSDPPIDSKGPYTIKAQKHSKEISRIIHVTLVVQLLFYEATRILFVCKENKSNDFIQQFASPYSAIFGVYHILGLGDVYQTGIGRCLQWNIMMDNDIGGVRGVPEAWICMQKGTENK